MPNVVNLGILPRDRDATSEAPFSDIARRIRAGGIAHKEIEALFEKSGFSDWYHRIGFTLYRNSVIGGGGSGERSD